MKREFKDSAKFMQEVEKISTDNPIRNFLIRNMHKPVVVYCEGNEKIEGILSGFNSYLNILVQTKLGTVLLRNYNKLSIDNKRDKPVQKQA